ncbi:uncharacterized protein EI97DRAFT_434260 [Westerdykella ornata]|uniref:F-box domain-containing protein n=1 Tax=Westerdykella ornata TaxID=318751 RepID=A0A6A6JHI3_WESOR|nr:uncharacterized protein EI97DRAFT_434260 [Westerdykella ornata]KAF2275418.1 hypothetical protein EI97DRAFT_434260 [Westerdykella ornata]
MVVETGCGPPMKRLDTLPNELIGEIAISLDNGTLATLSLVSRKLRAVAQGVLYR